MVGRAMAVAAMVMVVRASPSASVVAAAGRTQKARSNAGFLLRALEIRQLLLLAQSGWLAGPLSIR
jgi:hypothetical protein